MVINLQLFKTEQITCRIFCESTAQRCVHRGARYHICYFISYVICNTLVASHCRLQVSFTHILQDAQTHLVTDSEHCPDQSSKKEKEYLLCLANKMTVVAYQTA